MISVKTDLHTHTIFSGHAYSTIEENLRNGAEMGLEAMGVTDHFSAMPYPSTDFHYYAHLVNLHSLPREWYGIRLLHGAEVDIVGLKGELFGCDLIVPDVFGKREDPKTYKEVLLDPLDYMIASVHDSKFTDDATIGQTTEMYCRALEVPKVLFLGHIGRAGVPFDMDEVLLTAKKNHKMLEINDSSFGRSEKIQSKCREVAIRCAELGVSIAVNSDAHCSYYVGRYDGSLQMLEEIHFPQELIGNRDLKTLQTFLQKI